LWGISSFPLTPFSALFQALLIELPESPREVEDFSCNLFVVEFMELMLFATIKQRREVSPVRVKISRFYRLESEFAENLE